MSELLANSVAVVTGGASGIGRGIATSFAREGADVVVADVREAPKKGGQPTQELLRAEYDVRSGFVDCDVSNREDLETAVAAADEFGGIDVMVNNAGIFHVEEFLEATPEEYDRVMGINARGAYFGSQAAARHMVENGGGSIVNVSSINATLGSTWATAYSMSKAAVQLLTRSLAGKLGPEDVRVNAVHPGSIRSTIGVGVDIPDEALEDMGADIPLGRQGEPDDVGDVAVFLASDLARYVNGASVLVDGGMTVVA